MIFMHVDDVGDTGKGTIFTSDETGIIFSKSLEKNLYPNGDDVTDFVRIESLNGVYVTSQFSCFKYYALVFIAGFIYLLTCY